MANLKQVTRFYHENKREKHIVVALPKDGKEKYKQHKTKQHHGSW